MYGGRRVLVRQDGAVRAGDVRRRAGDAHVHLLSQGTVPCVAAGARAGSAGGAARV